VHLLKPKVKINNILISIRNTYRVFKHHMTHTSLLSAETKKLKEKQINSKLLEEIHRISKFYHQVWVS